MTEGNTYSKQDQEYYDFLGKVREAQEGNPAWRAGQAFFNVLCGVNRDLAERLRATDLDPFHNDAKLAEAQPWVYMHWATPCETVSTQCEHMRRMRALAEALDAQEGGS